MDTGYNYEIYSVIGNINHTENRGNEDLKERNDYVLGNETVFF